MCTPNEATKVYRTICGPASAYEGMSDEEIGKLVEQEWDTGEWHMDGIWIFDADKRIPLDGEGIARAEERSDVLCRPHVVEHDHQRQLGHRGELLGRRPAEFFVGDFAHNGFGTIDFGGKSK